VKNDLNRAFHGNRAYRTRASIDLLQLAKIVETAYGVQHAPLPARKHSAPVD
jgi:hypothetical protein